MSDGCRYCGGRSARYVVYVRDTERNLPSTEGTACTSIVACDCASPERRCALASGGGGPETKDHAATAREFVCYCESRGMQRGVHWALDPTALVKRLMLRAYPHPGGPLEGLRWEAKAELERLAGVEPAQETATVDAYGAQEAVSGPPPTQESPAPPASDSGAATDPWPNGYPAWMDGDYAEY